MTKISSTASVCRRWRQVAYDSKLWRNVSLRPEVSGNVQNLKKKFELIKCFIFLKVCMLAPMIRFSVWLPFVLGLLCVTSNSQSSWLHTPYFMNCRLSVQTWRTCCLIFRQVSASRHCVNPCWFTNAVYPLFLLSYAFFESIHVHFHSLPLALRKHIFTHYLLTNTTLWLFHKNNGAYRFFLSDLK